MCQRENWQRQKHKNTKDIEEGTRSIGGLRMDEEDRVTGGHGKEGGGYGQSIKY